MNYQFENNSPLLGVAPSKYDQQLVKENDFIFPLMFNNAEIQLISFNNEDPQLNNFYIRYKITQMLQMICQSQTMCMKSCGFQEILVLKGFHTTDDEEFTHINIVFSNPKNMNTKQSSVYHIYCNKDEDMFVKITKLESEFIVF